MTSDLDIWRDGSILQRLSHRCKNAQTVILKTLRTIKKVVKITALNRKNRAVNKKSKNVFLWPPYVADADTIFLPCGFFFLSFFLSFFSSPNLSRRRLYVCHTSTHGVALVRI